ncbi:MAG: 23S rRNA (adenine(2503)-C(2))-methyltransferase RlmN [Peptoniphilus sp.]|nr:23S rRNA (adenine(2503)-C(2))-methyltransferase RlmN [Peptoniphilus sp.]MDD7362945.1 23S rRNA (adenine(2503)-C(2))-methyltransferase RlmN [Bacillota bacterium]MDY6044185.1 23S rRNA (adenine(2503)-C(2))-methyltransferase RlmN [Peptoniphilus sp.]
MHWMEMTPHELKDFVVDLGEKSFRGTQLFEGIHGQRKDLAEMTNIPKSLVEALPEPLESVEIVKRLASKLDETKKYLYRLSDGEIVEGVLMKYRHGYSLCVSTQVGCRMGCKFCVSTLNGLIRNLRPFEMLSQVYAVEARENIHISNIILMGSGEPFDNYDHVLRFLRLLHEPKGQNMSYRNMTISSCGLVDGIKTLAEEGIPVNLAISLHETEQGERKKLMPVAARYDMAQLFDALRYYVDRTGQRITLEYTLIQGQNDGMRNIREFEELTRGLLCHVNLIPLNTTDHFSHTKPGREHILRFQRELSQRGISCTIRRELGSDIQASCGQLKAGAVAVEAR